MRDRDVEIIATIALVAGNGTALIVGFGIARARSIALHIAVDIDTELLRCAPGR